MAPGPLNPALSRLKSKITCEFVVVEMELLTTLVMTTVRVMRGSATEFS